MFGPPRCRACRRDPACCQTDTRKSTTRAEAAGTARTRSSRRSIAALDSRSSRTIRRGTRVGAQRRAPSSTNRGQSDPALPDRSSLESGSRTAPNCLWSLRNNGVHARRRNGNSPFQLRRRCARLGAAATGGIGTALVGKRRMTKPCAAGRAGPASGFLRGRGAGDRDRRARAGAVRPAGLCPPRDRPQQARRRRRCSARAPGSSTRSTRSRRARSPYSARTASRRAWNSRRMSAGCA